MGGMMNPLSLGDDSISGKERVRRMHLGDGADLFGTNARYDEKQADKEIAELAAKTKAETDAITGAAAEAEALALEEAKMEARKKLAYQTQTVFSSKFNSSLGNTSTLGSN